jgi:hypothetical protein
LIRKPIESGDEQSCREVDDKAEGHLHRDQRAHQASPRVWIVSAFKRANRPD